MLATPPRCSAPACCPTQLPEPSCSSSRRAASLLQALPSHRGTAGQHRASTSSLDLKRGFERSVPGITDPTQAHLSPSGPGHDQAHERRPGSRATPRPFLHRVWSDPSLSCCLRQSFPPKQPVGLPASQLSPDQPVGESCRRQHRGGHPPPEDPRPNRGLSPSAPPVRGLMSPAGSVDLKFKSFDDSIRKQAATEASLRKPLGAGSHSGCTLLAPAQQLCSGRFLWLPKSIQFCVPRRIFFVQLVPRYLEGGTRLG